MSTRLKLRARFVSWASIAALGAVLAAGLWGFVAAPLGQVCRLPDGSTLTLETVSYGRAHPYLHGSRWQKWLYPLVSPGLRDWSGLWGPSTGWTAGTYFSRTPSSLVLTARRRSTPRARFRGTAAVAVDPSGAELAPGLGTAGVEFPTAAGVDEVWELPVFPRRGKTVRVRVYQQAPVGEWDRVAEFMVPNPTPGAYPAWAPQSLPITKRAGDLSVTLARLTTGVIPEDPYHRSPPGDDRWTRAEFRTFQHGRPTSHWAATTVTLSDATGNTWTHRNQDRSVAGGVSRLQFAGSVPRTEAAWKLRVEFLRSAGFSPDELWRLSEVPVPAPN